MHIRKRASEHSSRDRTSSEDLLPFETGSITTIDDVLRNYFSIEADSVIRIGKFEACGWTGQGGQSTVIKAIDPDLQRVVAIKLYHAGLDEPQKQRLLSEGRALAQTDSPYIAKCYSVDIFAHAPFLVLEWVPGITLDVYLEESGVDDRSVRIMFTKILEGVGALHCQQLVHRDLKPGNIVVTEEGDPKIIDLGLAHHLQSTELSLGGTYSYMAPEVARREFKKIGIPTDIFGLGAILYFMLVGRPLYEGESKEESKAQAESCAIPDLTRESRIKSRDLIEICSRCLNEDRDDRFQSVDEILKRLTSSKTWETSAVKLLVGSTAVLAMTIGVIGVAMMVGLVSASSSVKSKSLPAAVALDTEALSPTMQVLELAHRESPDQAARVAEDAISGLLRDHPRDLYQIRRLHDLLVKVNLQSGRLDTAVANQDEIIRFEASQPRSKLQSEVTAEATIDRQQWGVLNTINKVQWAELRLGVSNLLRSRFLFEQGKFDQAVLPSRLAVERFESVVGANHLLSIEALHQFVEAQYAADERAEMERSFQKLGAALIVVYGEFSRKHCVHLAERSEFLRSQRRYVAALTYAKRAVEIAEQLVDADDRFLKNFEMLCGQILVQQKDSAGIANLESTLNSMSIEMPDALVAAARIDLAEAMFEQRQLIKSAQCLSVATPHVKEMRKRGFPQAEIMLARILALEGNIESSRGRFENAIDLHEQALSVLPNVKKQTISHTEFLKVFVRTLLRVADSKSTDKKLASQYNARARVLISEAIAILNKCFPVKDENYSLRMAELRCLSGQIEFSTQNPKSAYADFQLAIAQYETLDMNTARKRRLGGLHSWAADELIELGRLEDAKLQIERGRELLREVSRDQSVPKSDRLRVKNMELRFLDRQFNRIAALQLEVDPKMGHHPVGENEDTKKP